MKKLLIAAVVATISSGALASDLKPYIEGSVGYLKTNDVDTKTYSGNVDSISLAGRLKLNYDSDVIWGGEVGLRDVGIPNLRIGASYSHAEIDLNNINLTASATTLLKNNGGSTIGTLGINTSVTLDRAGVSGTLSGYVDNLGSTVALSGSVANSGLGADLLSLKTKLINDLKKDVNLYMVNAYYDFKNPTPITPYVGAGIGLAHLSNMKGSNLAYSLMAGAKYNINDNVYVGAKGTYTRIDAPTSNLYGANIDLKDIDLWRADAVVGYQF
jgi:opacity protein-like surface antigen